MADGFQCSVVTPEEKVFDGAVVHASIPGWDGQIGVMHLRAPLVAKLAPGPLRLDLPDGGQRWIFVGKGFAQVKDDVLSLVVEEAKPADQLDAEQIQTAHREAEASVAVGDEQIDKKQAELDRVRAMQQTLQQAR